MELQRDYPRRLKPPIRVAVSSTSSGITTQLAPGQYSVIGDVDVNWTRTSVYDAIIDLQTQLGAHVILTAASVHGAADTANVPSSTVSPYSLPTMFAAANNVRACFVSHISKTAGSVHGAADTTNTVTAPIATTWATLVALVTELLIDYAAHRVLTTDSVHGAADSTNVQTCAAPNVALTTNELLPSGTRLYFRVEDTWDGLIQFIGTTGQVWISEEV